MRDSALERAATDALGSFGDWLRGHDRMVMIGLLFSLLPLPPACFAGLMLSVANAWLLRTGSLPRAELNPVRWGVLLGLLNSTLVVGGMLWMRTHLHETARLISLPFLPDAVISVLNGLLDWFRAPATPIVLPT